MTFADRSAQKRKPTLTLDVIAATSGRDQVVIAGELVEVRFARGNGLSLLASKLLVVLLDQAGVAVIEDRDHSLPIAEINWSHRSMEDLADAVLELQQTVVQIVVKNDDGTSKTKSGQFLTDVARDHDYERGILKYKFSSTVRDIFKKSNYWAAVSARAVLSMESRYSVALYQLVALHWNRREISRVWSLDDLRALLGALAPALQRWQDFKRRALEPAVAEINHLTGHIIAWEPVMRGRSVVGVKLSWSAKTREAAIEAARELERPRFGRRARREQTVERITSDTHALRAQIAEELASLPTILPQARA